MNPAIIGVIVVVIIIIIGAVVYFLMPSEEDKAVAEAKKKEVEADAAALTADAVADAAADADADAKKKQEEADAAVADAAAVKAAADAAAAEALKKAEEEKKAKEFLNNVRAAALGALVPTHTGCYVKYDESCNLPSNDWNNLSKKGWALDVITAPGHPSGIFSNDKATCESGLTYSNFNARCPGKVQTKWIEKGDTSNQNNMTPGCYIKTPSGCPKNPNPYYDKYGKNDYIYYSQGGKTFEDCESVASTLNNKCGVTDADTVFLPGKN